MSFDFEEAFKNPIGGRGNVYYQFTAHQKDETLSKNDIQLTEGLLGYNGKLLRVYSIVRFHGNINMKNCPPFKKEEWAKIEGYSSYEGAYIAYSEKYGSNWEIEPLAIVQFEVLKFNDNIRMSSGNPYSCENCYSQSNCSERDPVFLDDIPCHVFKPIAPVK